jgi:glycosyltransferase involved in cell wall biosynthesis
MRLHKSLYAAFDVYPSPKGAGTHIYYMASTLFEFLKSGILCTLGNDKLPVYQDEDTVEICRFSESIPNYLQRAEAYSNFLFHLMKEQNEMELCHFRDIWSAIPLLQPTRKYKTVFEVNAIASIELTYAFEFISKETLEKIKSIENHCYKEVDVIITPSEIIRENLIKREVEAKKIKVITNGAYIPEPLPKPIEAPGKYIIYFGALQEWQGIDVLLKAFAGLRDYRELYLVICSSNRQNYSKPFIKLAEHLGINNKIIWNYQLTQQNLFAWIQHALASVAPLKECSRNIEQGCSPLKILESMACGVPVVASDIPVVREIITENHDGKLVRPNRPAELSRSLRFIIDYPAYASKIKENALETIKLKFTWEQKKKALFDIYSELVRFDYADIRNKIQEARL